MKMFKSALAALAICFVSAFAHAAVLDTSPIAQLEQSKSPVDAVAQHTEDSDYKLLEASNSNSLQVAHSEELNLYRSTFPAFELTTEVQIERLIQKDFEVGWRRSYSL